MDYYDWFFDQETFEDKNEYFRTRFDKFVSRVIKFASSDANVHMHMYQNYFETIESHKLTDRFWYFHKKEENIYLRIRFDKI